MTPKAFQKRMTQLGILVSRNADKQFRATALAIDSALVISTPVDTGTARSNWQVGSPGPITSVRSAYTPGAEGSTGGANARAAIEQAKAVIGTAKDTIHITNNLTYIEPLNEGSSAQAPAGFIEAAVEVGRTEARRFALLSPRGK